MGLGDDGEVALDGFGLQAAGGLAGVGGDGRGRRGKRGDFPALTESLKAGPVGLLGLDGTWAAFA